MEINVLILILKSLSQIHNSFVKSVKIKKIEKV